MKKQYKVLFASDFHGVFVCHKSLNCLINVLKSDKTIDEVVLNGDVLDFGLLSKHSKRLFLTGVMKGYTETKEIEFTKNEILTPIRKATKAKVVFRTGNHENRVTEPYSLSQNQLERLAELYSEYGTTELSEMLELEKLGIIYDGTPIRNYYDIFSCVHGLAVSKEAGRKNISSYMGSGTSGHCHRSSINYITNRHSSYCWLETGCMRTIDNVEYLPTAVPADWTNSFGVVTFDLSNTKQPLFFAESHVIIGGKTAYNGKIISC